MADATTFPTPPTRDPLGKRALGERAVEFALGQLRKGASVTPESTPALADAGQEDAPTPLSVADAGELSMYDAKKTLVHLGLVTQMAMEGLVKVLGVPDDVGRGLPVPLFVLLLYGDEVLEDLVDIRRFPPQNLEDISQALMTMSATHACMSLFYASVHHQLEFLHERPGARFLATGVTVRSLFMAPKSADRSLDMAHAFSVFLWVCPETNRLVGLVVDPQGARDEEGEEYKWSALARLHLERELRTLLGSRVSVDLLGVDVQQGDSFCQTYSMALVPIFQWVLLHSGTTGTLDDVKSQMQTVMRWLRSHKRAKQSLLRSLWEQVHPRLRGLLQEARRLTRVLHSRVADEAWSRVLDNLGVYHQEDDDAWNKGLSPGDLVDDLQNDIARVLKSKLD